MGVTESKKSQKVTLQDYWDRRHMVIGRIISETYLGPCQTTKMKLFAKILIGLKPLNIFAKISILDV